MKAKALVVLLTMTACAYGWTSLDSTSRRSSWPFWGSTSPSQPLVVVPSIHSPLPAPRSRSGNCCSSKTALWSKVESFTLEALSPDHEAVGQALADSLQKMLDAEWMVQDVHAQVAARVRTTYIDCRTNGENDLMAIMMATATNLSDHWTAEWERDLFVNVWDVANYVSDYLTVQAGSDGCGCTQTIY